MSDTNKFPSLMEKTSFSGVYVTKDFRVAFDDVFIESINGAKRVVTINVLSQNLEEIEISIDPQLDGTALSVYFSNWESLNNSWSLIKASKVIVWATNQAEKQEWEYWLRHTIQDRDASAQLAKPRKRLIKISPLGLSRSVQREIQRIRDLGEEVVVNNDTITISSEVVPLEILDEFIKRIKELDPEDKLKIKITG